MQLRHLFPIAFCFISIDIHASTSGAASSCKSRTNWTQNFEARNRELQEYRGSIERTFQNRRAGRTAPSCEEPQPAPTEPPLPGMRTGCVPTRGIRGLGALPCFKYRVLPGRNASNGTVISFMGGPGDSVSVVSPRGFQYNNHTRIIFDDIGIGENSFPIPRNFSESSILTENQTELVRRIIEAEKLQSYALEGGSFGTVSATIVASQLSQNPSRRIPAPRAVILSGVADRQVSSANAEGSVMGSAQVRSDRVCVLPSGTQCLEDAGLALLTDSERRAYHLRLRTIFTTSGLEPLRTMIQDAIRWYKVQGPEVIASFVRKRIIANLGTDYDQLECWYRERLGDIPWLQPHVSASQGAFSAVNNCFLFDRSLRQERGVCACLTNLPVYSPSRSQIKSPTAIVYVNGDADPQTPFAEAQSHFNQQDTDQKVLIRVCSAGHFPMQPGPPSRQERFVSSDQVISLALERDLSALRSVDGYCSQAPAPDLSRGVR